MRRILSRFVAILAFSCSLRTYAAPIVVNLPQPAAGFAVSNTGGVATIDADSTVTLFPKISTGDIANPVSKTVGNKLLAITWKAVARNGYFLVLSQADQSLYILDDKTLNVVKAIPFPNAVYSLAAPASPEAAFALVAHPEASSTNGDGGISRVNLATLSLQGKLQGVLGHERPSLAISRDGSHLYSQDKSTTASWAVTVYQLSDLVATRTASNSRPSGAYLPDATGQHIATGIFLLRADGHGASIKLDISPVAFFPDRPLMVGLAGDKLEIASANSYKTLDTVQIPRDTTPRPATPRSVRSGSTGPCVLCDTANNAVLVCRDDRVVVASLADLKLPSEPFLYARIEGPRELQVGKPATIRITPLDPTATITLAAAPPAARFADGQAPPPNPEG